MPEHFHEAARLCSLRKFRTFLNEYAEARGSIDRSAIVKALSERFELQKGRSVYYSDPISFRFSRASGTPFSNTVLALSTLRKYDESPFVVCITGGNVLRFLLANSTFLSKISHSSQNLRVDRVRGSFNGTDILREYGGLRNTPANFEELFQLHSQYTWDENLSRLVLSTSGIVATGTSFVPSSRERRLIAEAPFVAQRVSKSKEYVEIARALDELVGDRAAELFEAAAIDNVKLRGDAIEKILSSAVPNHALDDLLYQLGSDTRLIVDIKSKLLDLQSSPKGYNVDKVLRSLAQGGTTMSYYFIGIERATKEIRTALVSIFDTCILRSTRIQFHWAGRNSRGVTQLTSSAGDVFNPDFRETIDLGAAEKLLERLLVDS